MQTNTTKRRVKRKDNPVSYEIKRAVIWAYLMGLLPVRAVSAAFRVFKLRNE